jgi:hypothetical protein
MAGALAGLIGAPITVLIGGISCLTGSLIFAYWLPTFRKYVRPVYVRMGIIPELAVGIGAASELSIPPEEQ